MAKRKPAGGKKTSVNKAAQKKSPPAACKKASSDKATVKKPKSQSKEKKTMKSEQASGPRPGPTNATRRGSTLHALVIGCDCYLANRLPEGSYLSLNGCVCDAERVEQFLRERAGLTDDRLIKLTSSDNGQGQPRETKEKLPTYENMVAGFKTITARARKGDHVYIHYSGHGGRCPTIVPQLKSRDGLDESLVPIDIGDSTARYVRDVEIAKLLKDMSDKELVVTAVMDCCHSGGLTRAVVRGEDEVRVRGVEFIDHTPRPTDSLVGTAEELGTVLQTRSAEGTRGMASAAEAGGGVVLAACRPSELARECSFDGSEPQGALTYWYLTVAGHAPEDLTFRTIYDIVQARIHGKFPEQTPMLFGNPDRKIFSGLSVPATPAVPVSAVSTNGQSLTLASGQSGLIQVGMDFAIYPPGADVAQADARIALARVMAVNATTSTAQVTKTLGDRKTQVGDHAIAVGVAQKLIRKVRLTPHPKAPSTAAKALRLVEQEVKNQKWVELVGGADAAADFLVTTTEDGNHYEICDVGGISLEIHPPLTTAPSSAKAVAERLVHLTRFQAVRGLDNPDPFSALRGKLVVELYATPAGYQGNDPPTKLKRIPPGRIPSLKPGEWIILSVTNQSSSVLNAVVFDLAADWEVSVAHPNESFHPIDGGATWQLPLQASLPKGQKKGKDILKVIATVDPPPPYELLTLPRLDNPIPPESQRGGVTRSAGPLVGLFAAVTADNPTRALSAIGQTSRGWTVAHAEIEIQ